MSICDSTLAPVSPISLRVVGTDGKRRPRYQPTAIEEENFELIAPSGARVAAYLYLWRIGDLPDGFLDRKISLDGPDGYVWTIETTRHPVAGAEFLAPGC